MNPMLKQALNESPYDQLPDGIKAMYTRDQYLWLSDREKALLEQTDTEPETEL